MSDLPDLALIRRLVNDFGEVWDREIIDAFKAGELLTLAEALEALKTALIGEHEPISEFGDWEAVPDE